jgi:hypothetical protein
MFDQQERNSLQVNVRAALQNSKHFIALPFIVSSMGCVCAVGRFFLIVIGCTKQMSNLQ